MNRQTRMLALLVLLGAVPSAAAGPQTPAARTVAECTNKDETALLHHRLSIPPFSVWDSQNKEWRGTLPNEGPASSTKIRVVHVWGTWCKPCAEEFPIIKQMDLQIRADYRGDVQFVYVADTLSSKKEMAEFMGKHHESMPLGLLFRDDEDKLGADLRGVLPQMTAAQSRPDSPSERQLNLPLTMLVDQNNVVRQAFVGSLLPRRADLVNGIAQLYRSMGGAAPVSKQKVATKPSRKQG